MKRVAILMAMEAEAMPLVEALALREEPDFGDPRLPFRYFRGDFRGRLEIVLGLSGKDPRYGVDNIGTEPAALAAYALLSRFKADCLINAGTAGGFAKRGARIGDVYLSDRPFRFHDRRIAIPGFDAYGLGSYPVWAPEDLARAAGLMTGAVSTGNSLDHTEKCLGLMDAGNASVKEMEAAAIAWVAWLLRVPFFALKSVTDIVDGPHPSEEEFLRNLDHASQILREKVLAVLVHLSGEESMRAH